MITEDQMHLISAAVDGELSQSEAQCLRRLLDASTEARALYAKLKGDSTRLRKLPRVTSPADLHKRVMARVATATPPPITIPVRKAEPATIPFAPAKATTRRWVPVAVAASLLVSVAGSSFWYFTRDNSTTFARNSNRPPPATHNGAGDPAWANWLPADGARPPSAPLPHEREGSGNIVVQQDPPVRSGPVEHTPVVVAPSPRLHSDVHASPFSPEVPPFDRVEVRIPFLKPLSDFDRDDIRKQLIDEFAHDPAFRIDIFVRNTARGVELFQSAAKAAGLTIHLDAATMTGLKKGTVASVLVYSESLTADELTDLFAKLNGEDAKISPRVFDALHASPVIRADELELRSVLGIDPGIFS